MAGSTREEGLTTVEDGQTKLDTQLAQLSDEQLVKPAAMGGGDWSAKDAMCHVAHWNELAMEALAAWRKGEKPAIEDQWDDVDKINAANYERSKDSSPDDAWARMRDAHEAITSAIREMDNAEWNAEAPYQTERRAWLGRVLGTTTGAPQLAYGHAFAHLPDLEAYVLELRK